MKASSNYTQRHGLRVREYTDGGAGRWQLWIETIADIPCWSFAAVGGKPLSWPVCDTQDAIWCLRHSLATGKGSWVEDLHVKAHLDGLQLIDGITEAETHIPADVALLLSQEMEQVQGGVSWDALDRMELASPVERPALTDVLHRMRSLAAVS